MLMSTYQAPLGYVSLNTLETHMKYLNKRSLVATALIAPLALFGLANNAAAGESTESTIYTQTNATAGNQILAFQNVNGVLTATGAYSTGGLGSGNGLGSQGAIVTSDHRLVAVNAGSNQVSLFTISSNGALKLRSVASSNGVRPISVTVHDDLVYVVNGSSRNVTGFRIDDNQLAPIAGSTQALPGNGAAQISFDNYGTRLVVAEKATNTLDVLPVSANGVAGAAVSNPSTGQTPFGFAIDKSNHVIVSNAAGGAAGASSLSSYSFAGATGLAPISSAVASTQSAACWVALSADSKFAYSTNTGSGTISSYTVGNDGTLTLLKAVALSPGSGPLDMVTVGRSVFTLAGAVHTISVAAIGSTGALTGGSGVPVPTGVVGLAAS